MIIEIMAYVSVGMLTFSWVISMVMDFLKKRFETHEDSSAVLEDGI